VDDRGVCDIGLVYFDAGAGVVGGDMNDTFNETDTPIIRRPPAPPENVKAERTPKDIAVFILGWIVLVIFSLDCLWLAFCFVAFVARLVGSAVWS
jgi:hypothetical protein